MIKPQKLWYAVYTFSRSEKKLAEQLSKRGMNHYLPLIPIKRQWSDRIKTIHAPVFSSYVFVQIDIRSEKIRVLETPGAHHFLSVSGAPHAIPEEDMDFIRDLVDEYPDRIRIEKENSLQPGKKVLITAGRFKGRRAQVVRKGNKASVKVSLSGIDTAIYLDLNSELLETAEEN
ncbi:UpxY family transcription antiterminator [Leptospira wolffii]|uniref:Transcription antiterminator n=1 Tax=Leptospira wolffii TaxID=409998 RepID=A0A2M9ZF18_9LEPT|nr:UpxY family transcription antiterminator [Leptospira wolffii]PJZ66927.1 transcription antiterminator [Leptospira wolffii]TGK61899.1 UpxY family transcription antiterminator [Leptospira wolffii]TGK68500.1 UpxY family transcription antiterminator [Leptospira wolffii]TGK74717.1 UpxY family transcription antiterminator [Leptospira wolffii]TGL31707.1 UpxY family transcription antiterminator [Leptospira wolffii]